MAEIIKLEYNKESLFIREDIISNLHFLLNSDEFINKTNHIIQKYGFESNANFKNLMNNNPQIELFKKMVKQGYFHTEYQQHLQNEYLSSVESMLRVINKNINLCHDIVFQKLKEKEDNEDKINISNFTTLTDDEVEEIISYEDDQKNKFQIETTYTTNKIKNDIYPSNKNDKLSKVNKNQITIINRSNEERIFYQQQEIERYKHPHLPWIFYNFDGTDKSIVAPLLKKPPSLNNSKPRDHILLKKSRPGFITILSLARDAASRLPNSVGTRADICDLIKDSHYINERIPDLQINTIVSGALDRLHYEKDPCVKYDVQSKVWIYLHGNRTLDYPGWCDHLKGLSSNFKINISSDFEKLKMTVVENTLDNNVFTYSGGYTKSKQDQQSSVGNDDINSSYTKNISRIRLPFGESNLDDQEEDAININDDNEYSQDDNEYREVNFDNECKSLFLKKKRAY